MSNVCPVADDKAHRFASQKLKSGEQWYCDVCAFTIWDHSYVCTLCKAVCHGPCRNGQRQPTDTPSADSTADSSPISMPDTLSVGTLDNCGPDVFACIVPFAVSKDVLQMMLTSRSMYFLVKRAIHPYDAATLKCSLLNTHFGDEPLDLADGEYTLYYRGNPSRPFQAYIAGFAGSNPKEYLTLHETKGDDSTNFSEYNPSYSAKGEKLRTRFTRLRFNPITLMVKTDDYTFAKSSGKITQTYWNGQRRIVFQELPYATARGCGQMGSANIDLRGTPFAVASRFAAMGCGPGGEITLGHDGAPGQVLDMVGDGFCGRVCPALDVTKVEKGQHGNYDNEGVNGGWVLQLAWAADASVEDVAQLTELVPEASLLDTLWGTEQEESQDYSPP